MRRRKMEGNDTRQKRREGGGEGKRRKKEDEKEEISPLMKWKEGASFGIDVNYRNCNLFYSSADENTSA